MPDSLNYSSVAGAMLLTSSINASATSIGVSTVAGLPVAPFKILLDPGLISEEVVKVAAVSGLNLTGCTRGYDGTTAASHIAGSTARHAITAEDLQLSRHHEGLTSLVHGTTGAVVGASDAQTLTNKDLTSGTNTFPSTAATVQTLTNKDLTSATNTFPAALATLTTAQALTNKDLTSATNAFPAGYGVTSCTSTTRPTTGLYDGRRIFETDTKAQGVYNLALTKWMMFDTVKQTFASVWSSQDGPITPGTGGYVDMRYKRVGDTCKVWTRTYSGGAGFAAVGGEFRWTLPFTSAPAGTNNTVSNGVAHLAVRAGAWDFTGVSLVGASASYMSMLATYYNGGSTDGMRLFAARNADTGGNVAGTGIPRFAGVYTIDATNWAMIDSYVEYNLP